MAEVKTRRIREKDWKALETYINDELDTRAKSQFRKSHEEKWKEVDRQIAMNPPSKVVDGQVMTVGEAWQAAFELGELSKASEIITDDVMRITFPDDNWFEPHVELDRSFGANGRPQPVPEGKQRIADGLLRSLMVQQHKDFGFKGRFRLSVKEALHHGGFVALPKWSQEMYVYDGERVKLVAAPVWQPISMWNAFPDPSPSVIGTNLFYTGSMIFNEFMPKWKLKQIAKGDGWMPKRLEKIPDEEHENGTVKTKDLKLTYYFGDLNIDREDGDMFYPNSYAILANGVLVYMAPNQLPYPSVIYGGYERNDIRDPYYTSPIIKQSPMQKITTTIANRFIDSIELKVRPPIEYDGNDPDYVANDGPTIAPGAKTPTKSMGKGMQALDVGDPRWGLEGLQMGLRQMQEGTGVSSLRTGVTNSDRQTATEVQKTQQGAEVRTVAFVAMLEEGGLRPWLYMQHELNRKNLKEYSFYNSEMSTPDFIRATTNDIQANAHFDVVGSRGLLGEEQRTQRVGALTAFYSQSPLFAPLLKPQDIMLQSYRDAGLKNPEQYVQVGQQQIPPEVQQKLQQAQQIISQLQAENQQLKTGQQAKILDIRAKAQAKSQEIASKERIAGAQMQHQARMDMAEMANNQRQQNEENALTAREKAADIDLKQAQTVKTLVEAAHVPDKQLEKDATTEESA